MSARVLLHVGERLGDDEVRRRLDLLGEPLLGSFGQLDRHRRPQCQRVERRGQSSFREHRRVQAPRQLPELLQAGRELVDRQVEQLAGAAVVAAQPAETEQNRGQPLLSSVVEVSLDPSPLGVRDLDEPCA